MRDERWLEQQMAEWIAAGPDDAPERPLERAVAFARAHPHRRVLGAGLRRSLVHRVSLAGAGWLPALHVPLLPLGAAAAVVVVVMVSAIVTSGGLRDQRGGGILPIPPSATPTLPATPSPATLAPLPARPVDVSATSVCATASPGTITQAGEITQRRGVVLRCDVSGSDPRVGGTMTLDLSTDQRPDGGADSWGAAALSGPGGTWTGPWIGTVDAGDGIHRLTGVLLGTGSDAGLRLRYAQVTEGEGYRLTGTIERADASPPADASVILGTDCYIAMSGAVTTVGDVTRTRGLVLGCSPVASDPRLLGDYRVSVSIDEHPDGSADLQGTLTIKDATGGWTGRWTGSVDVGYTTHHMHGVLAGSGAYAGLQWDFTQVGGADLVYVAVGSIGPAG